MFRPKNCLILLAALPAAVAAADDSASESWQSAAQKLQQATATIRIWSGQPTAPTPYSQLPTPHPPAAVTVASAICVREGLVITAAVAGSVSPVRLTLSAGKQADAKIVAIDEYSGLALLKADTAPLVPLVPLGAAPAVGVEILAASAWGLERPLVSRGIVGGIDRIYPGTNYPPLLQCDCIITATSTGSGIVDRQGRLLGVVVATDREPNHRGWTYAVPVSHVVRLLRAAAEQKSDGIVILKRRRPVVGMVLDQEADAIMVTRITPGGPADTAGIKPGDQIVMTDGVAIRSVYQAVLPTLHKQPGDTTAFRIHRDGLIHDFTVTLGGGIELDAASTDLLADLVQPKVFLNRTSDGAIVTTRGPAPAPTVAVQPPLPNDLPPVIAPTSTDKIALLEKALARYQAVIELQQKQLADQGQHRREQEVLLQSLRADINALRRAAK